MRSILVSLSLIVLACSTSLAQESLCNPCVDPPIRAPGQDLRSIETRPVVEGFNFGAAAAELRSLLLTDSRRAVDNEALLAAARSLMPPEMTDADVSLTLGGGLWRRDAGAVAVTLPRANGTLAFVFVRQLDGSFAATDATQVIARSAFGFFGWPEEEYERYEIELLDWTLRDGDPSLLRVQVRAWREGRRYTTGGQFLVGADGWFSAP